jgi:NAD(P)-dependent dehydrogenase (short-subunit alcohol dehydrogenase family)
MDLRGAAVLVTGGSAGLGAALGRDLAREGARVVLAARGEGRLRAVAEEIRARGGEAHAIVADVADPQAVLRLVGAASALVGPIDVVVHNASVLGALPLRELLDTPDRDFAAVLEANLLGPFRLTRAVAGSMALRGRGLVVAVTSDAGAVAYPRWGAYGVSKAALDHLVRVWAAELDGTGVRFLTVDPGEMATQMHADAIPDADPRTLARPEDVAARIVRLIAASESGPSGARIAVADLPAARAGSRS